MRGAYAHHAEFIKSEATLARLRILLVGEVACGSINKDTELLHHTWNKAPQLRALTQLYGWLALAFVCLQGEMTEIPKQRSLRENQNVTWEFLSFAECKESDK